MKIAVLFGFLSAVSFVSSCGQPAPTESEPDAYGAGANETHLVVAAPPPGNENKQRLWVCKGTKVQEGTPLDGYLVSIGAGVGNYKKPANQSVENRNKKDTNLTPLGEMYISRMIKATCAKGMEARCMQLTGVEKGVNNNTVNRGIFIHGTPKGNYWKLGTSASHGCVRMKHEDVIKVFDLVKQKTRVFINSVGVEKNENPCDFEGKAR